MAAGVLVSPRLGQAVLGAGHEGRVLPELLLVLANGRAERAVVAALVPQVVVHARFDGRPCQAQEPLIGDERSVGVGRAGRRVVRLAKPNEPLPRRDPLPLAVGLLVLALLVEPV